MYLVVVLGTIATARAFGSASDQPIAQTVAEALDVLKFGFTSLTTAPKLTLLGLNALALIGMAWTLSYEWAFYLILVPAATFCKSRVGVGIVLATGAALAWGDFHEHSEMVIWPFFLPGVVAAVVIRRVPELPQSVRTALAFGAIPIIGLILWLPTFWTMPKLLLAAALFFITLVSRPGVLLWPVLQVIGRISYSVYLLQYLVIFNSTIIIYGHPHLFGHSAAILLSAAAMMILIVLVATATYRFIELPCIRLTKLLGSAAPAIAGLTPDLSETRHES
jgi:peptidoglycan/LPS O-acetylase OafA/YrhL